MIATDLQIATLAREQTEAACDVASAAFWPTPSNAAVFPGRSEAARRRQRAGMRIMLTRMEGDLLVACAGDEVAGVLRHVGSERCQPRGLAQLQLAPRLLAALRTDMPRFGKWFGTWGKHDPSERHDHLGPVAVDPKYQGQGVGSFLLERYVAGLDASGTPGYLETEQERNVRLYERFGFRVVEQVEVLGVNTWLMWRDATPVAG